MIEIFAPNLEPRPDDLARDEFFKRARQAIVQTIDPADFHPQRIIGESISKAQVLAPKQQQQQETKLVSFKGVDPRDLRLKLDFAEMTTLQELSEKYKVEKRKKEISALVDKLYEVETFTDKKLKGKLRETLEFMEFGISVMAGDKKVDYIPEVFTNAVHALVIRDVLTTKQVEKFIFKSDNPPLAAVQLINLFNTYHQAFVDRLPEGFKPHQVQEGDKKAEALYIEVHNELKPKFLEEYGIE